MKEGMDQIGTLEEIMNIDKITIASREEKKKTDDMEDKIGGKKEDSMNIKIIKDIEATVGIIETEENMEENTLATIDQGPEGLAWGFLARGGLLQATPWP